jgi:acyl dehydratase
MKLPEPKTLPPMTRTDFVRYQGASGDMNPVHHDEPFATGAGYPAPLAVGMYAAGALCAWASDHVGPDRVRRSRMRWRKPSFPGTVLTFSAEEAEVTDDGFTWHLTATDQDGDVSLEAWVSFAAEEGA